MYAEPEIPGCRIEHLLAEGGTAWVYAAKQEALRRPVAVKVVKAGDPGLVERFLLEARLLAAMNHRHVVTIYDVGTLADGRPYLTMERLEGGDLRSRMASRNWQDHEVLDWMRQLASALEAIHRQGVVHRDVKPGNILFRRDGSLVLSDFGIAKHHEIDLDLTQTGTIVGSPAYASPEQVSAAKLDARSDQYSMGVVLAELLLGRNPYRADQYTATLINHLQMPAPQLPVRFVCWQPLLDRLLAKQPEDRFPDMVAVLKALGGMAQGSSGEEPTLVGIPAYRPAGAGVARRRIQISVLVLLFGAVLSLAGVWGYRYWQTTKWLSLAGQRRAQGHLLQPETDNAVYYYRRVLDRNASNALARAGLSAIITDFVGRVHADEAAGQWAWAERDIGHMAEVDRFDPRVARMRSELIQSQQIWAKNHSVKTTGKKEVRSGRHHKHDQTKPSHTRFGSWLKKLF